MPCLQLSKEVVLNSAEFADCVTVGDVFIEHLRVHGRGERSFRESTGKLQGDGNRFPRLSDHSKRARNVITATVTPNVSPRFPP